MKVQITITNDDGTEYSGEIELSQLIPVSSKNRPYESTSDQLTINNAVDFELPLRPFMKRYGQSMSGPKRLTLLVARLSNGNSEITVARPDVVKNWNKMSSLMGGRFNSAYETRARDGGWITSPKPGIFTLRPNWQEVLL